MASASSPSAEEAARQPKSSALQAGRPREPRSTSLKPADKRTNRNQQKNTPKNESDERFYNQAFNQNC